MSEEWWNLRIRCLTAFETEEQARAFADGEGLVALLDGIMGAFEEAGCNMVATVQVVRATDEA